MLRRIWFWILFFPVTGVFAQDYDDGIHKDGITLKPIGIIDPFLSNFTFGYQHRLSPKFMVELNAGLIKTWYCSFVHLEDETNITGFKVGGEMKYIFYRKMFVAAQLFHNNYNEKSEELLWRYGRVYTEEVTTEKHVTATGVHFKFGVFLHTKGRLFFEFYGGPGFRYRTITLKDFPEDAEPVEPVNFFDPDNFAEEMRDSRWYASLALGFGIGWRLGK